MATIYATFSAGEQIRPGLAGLVLKGSFSRSESITSSGTSAQSTITAKRGETVVRVAATDGAIAVNAGANPTATLASGIAIPSGGFEYISVAEGDKIAVIDI